LAKIAVELERELMRRKQLGGQGRTEPRIIARGQGWTVADVVCTSGPHDHAFEEQHTNYALAMVVAGSFQYRSSLGQGFMTPGSLMLGTRVSAMNAGTSTARATAAWPSGTPLSISSGLQPTQACAGG
jgi:hypothetical protein